jgi:hypothetical protein
MVITYSDEEIDELIQERKVLSNNRRNQLYREEKLDVNGNNGNKFRIIVRQNKQRLLDFSAILAVFAPQLNRYFRLRRYNGATHTHTNRIEREEVNGFHIHFATEKYQLKGLREDAYAEATGRYNNLNDALQCLIEDATFEEPPQLQPELF